MIKTNTYVTHEASSNLHETSTNVSTFNNSLFKNINENDSKEKILLNVEVVAQQVEFGPTTKAKYSALEKMIQYIC